MLADILSIGFVVVIFWLVIWLLKKQDDSDCFSSEQPSAPVKFERLSTLAQLNLLLNKLEELEQLNLSPCKTKLKTVADRIKNVNRYLTKSELLFKDELMQYEIAIDWIKSPAEFRNKCGPPKFFPAYSPLTGTDIKRLTELTLPPVDFTRTPVGPLRWSVASGNSSLPIVDQWLANVSCSMVDNLEKVWNMKAKVSSWTFTDYFAEHGGLIDFLRRAIVVSAEEDANGNKTIFILDFMVPHNVTLDRIPEVKAIGLPIKPLKGLCCTPVKYTETNA
ncbi:hypothetical protein ACI65C_004776 [Semiaphis heraclei]